MIRESGDHVEVSGAMTLDEARVLLAEGERFLSRPENVFDLSAVTEVDSSGLAVVFGWQRSALKRGKALRLENLPESLLSLAGVYGVSELLPLS